MASHYLHIQCDSYALLSNVADVEQVISGSWAQAATVRWQEQDLPCINLLALLTGEENCESRHCIVMKSPHNHATIAVLVGRVNNVEIIADQEFEDLPNLDFPFNDYFDKVYLRKTDKRCIYRLKNLSALEAGHTTTI